VLAWAEDGTTPLDEARVKSRWPQAKGFQQVGKNLFLVSGVQPDGARSGPAPAPSLGCPRAQGEQLLAAARGVGDRRGEATALTDLGIMSMSEGDNPRAIERLEEALAIARELGDRAAESDVLGNLGLAALAAGQPALAGELFAQQLQLAGDRFAAKLALERLGLACSSLRDHARALGFFEQALALTRAAGDRQHEAKLLWHLGVQYAELGQRDAAAAQAQAAIDLLETMADPQADLFAHHLRMYLVDDTGAPRDDGRPAGLTMPATSVFGGSIDAGLVASQPVPRPAQGRASGPGLLRMALSAAKSATRFLGSGLKTVAAETQQKRLRTCQGCEHHTGLRCRVCGCFTNIKTRMPHEACPIGKWPI
jgi:tetratricopeptide (TPR) repeat protein